MSFTGGLVEFRLTLEPGDFEKRLNDEVDKAAKKGKATLDARLAQTSQSLTTFGRDATTKMTLPIVAGLGFATKAASDLEESINVTGLTFGEARGEIDKFVSTSARGLGISETAARQATAQFGGLLLNMELTEEESVRYSKTLTTMSSDLASAFNTAPEDAALALGAALRGETEPIRRFNVFLSQTAIQSRAVADGLIAEGEELNNAAKARAALSLITEQTARVQGDFANTVEGTANASRVAKAELTDAAAALGANLLPVAAEAASTVADLAAGFSDLDPQMQKAVIAALGLTAAIGPLSLLAGNALKAYQALGDGIDKIGKRGAVGVGLLTGAVALVVNEFREAEAAGEDFVDEFLGDVDTTSLDDMIASVKLLGGEVEGLRTEFLTADAKAGDFNANLQAGKRAVGGLIQTFSPLRDTIAETTAKIDQGTAANDEYVAKIEQADRILGNFAQTTGLTRDEVDALAASAGIDLTGAYGDVSNALFDAHAATKVLSPATRQLEDATADLTSEVASAEDQMKAFDDALDALLGTTLSADEAQINFAESVHDLSTAIQENGTQVGLADEKQRALSRALLDTVEAAREEVDALVESGEITGDAATRKQELIDRLASLKKAFPDLAPSIDGYIAKIGAIPDEVVTEPVFANGPALADVEELKQALASIPGAVFTRADFDPTQLFLQGRQHGGPVRRGEAYLVGEGGRPEVFVPSADGTVVPIDAAHPVSGGVVVHGPLATFAITGAGADVEAAVRRAANEELVPVFDRLLDRLAAGAGTRS